MIDLVAVQRAVNILAQRAGLRVRYVREQMFATEPGGTLIIQRPQLNWTNAMLRVWRNAVCHEIGHWLPECRDIFKVLTDKKISTNNVFGACLNIVDDYRNDTNRCKVYPGTRADKVFTTEYLITRNWIPQIVSGKTQVELANRVVNTMVAASVGMLAINEPDLAKTFTSIVTVLDAEQKEWIDAIERDGWFDRWYALDSAIDEWKFVKDILKEVFKLPDDEIEQMSNPSKSEQGEDGEDGEGEPSEGNGDPSDESGDGEGKDISKQIVTVKYDEVMGQRKHSKRNESLGGIHIDYDNYTMGSYDPHTPETTRIAYPEDVREHGDRYHKQWCEWIEQCMEQSQVATVAQQARRFLQTETRKLFKPNERRGKLDTRKLARLVTHNPESSLGPAIFKQQAQKHAIDTCVSVLVDCSGSMRYESKYPLAVAASWGMIDICNTLRIPIEVAAFTEYSDDRNDHYLFKEFDKKVTKEKIVERGAWSAENMQSNADGDSILVAYNRILQRPEPKKLIIVMSDGQPAGDRGDAMSFTKQVVKNIEKDHKVDIMGIGILDRNVELIYSNRVVIDRAGDIPAALIDVLKTNVTSK